MANGRMPHLMFTAPRGCGKTMMASALADCLKWREPNKTKIVFNCSQLRNLRQFWNEVIIPHVNDKDVTVLFDEASEMPKDVMMALLKVLNLPIIHIRLCRHTTQCSSRLSPHLLLKNKHINISH